MRPARRSSPLYVAGVVAVGLVVGRLMPPLIVRFDGASPPVPGWAPTFVLAAGAVAVAVMAWSTWQNLHRKSRRITHHHAVRLLSLAKASVMVGGVFAGGYGGYALAYWGADSRLGEARFWQSTAAAVAAVLLLVAALLLERACQLPSDGDDEETSRQADPSPA